MKRKKQGATLIVVIIIFMFVSTVSMAMVSTILGNYKARVAESKRAENIYASDSGLDVAYNVISKTFDVAAKYGKAKMDTLGSSNNKGPNNEKYTKLQTEINDLTESINMLEAQKNNSDNISQINKQIIENRSLIKEDKEMQEILRNEEFKRAFKNFIVKTSDSTDEEHVPDKRLEDSIVAHKYVSCVFNKDNINGNNFHEEIINFNIQNKDGKSPILSLMDPIVFKSVSGSSDKTYNMKAGHSSEVAALAIAKSSDKECNIVIGSDFYTETIKDDNNKEILTNKRKVQAKYAMFVPNYKDIFFEKSAEDLKLQEYLALKDKALTIGLDMNVENSNLTVENGDVFVNGNDNSTSNMVYGKYFGGITLNNSSANSYKALFNNNVITRGTFMIKNNVGVDKDNPAVVRGNLYARNIYAGLENGDGYADNSYLNINGQAVLDNDLALKATNTHIVINDFYGINDKNIQYKDTISNSNPNDIARTSSSIIINGYTDQNGGNSSSVEIKDRAYIMGTAHIATDGNYQTGESTAVKNTVKDANNMIKNKANYEAYSVPIPNMSDSSGKAESFTYDSPLQLLKEPNVFTKGEHFKAYWNELNPTKVDRGGITFDHPDNDHLFSIGAVVVSDSNGNKVLSSNYNQRLQFVDQSDITNDGDITKKRIEYASKVYKFGQTPQNTNERDAMLATYNLLGTDEIKVENLMNFSEDFPRDYNSDNGDDYNLDTERNSGGEKAIFNSDSAKSIVIKGDSSTQSYEDTNKYIIIDGSNNKEVKAVIATLGNVIIDGNVTFSGSIIAKGSLTITGNVKIKYDQSVIERIQADHIKLFNNVFGGSIIKSGDSTEGTGSNEDGTNTLDVKYDLNNFLRKQLWKIIQ